jgi:hypothetical protein
LTGFSGTINLPKKMSLGDCPLNSGVEHRYPTNVRFTPESRHVRCKRPCLLWANSGHGLTALLTKADSRGRESLIRRLLNAAKHKRTNDCDGDCRNACKNEGSHDLPVSIQAKRQQAFYEQVSNH